MTEIQNPKREYDLEETTFQFAKGVRFFVKTWPKTIADIEDGKQLIKASSMFWSLNIDVWDFIGIWCLKFEISQYLKTQGRLLSKLPFS